MTNPTTALDPHQFSSGLIRPINGLSTSDVWMPYFAENADFFRTVTLYIGGKEVDDTSGGATGADVSIPTETISEYVKQAAAPEEIISYIRLAGSNSIGERLEAILIDREVGIDVSPLSLDSLRDFALFFIDHKNIREPMTGVSSDGFMQSEWHFNRNKHVIVKFFGNQIVRLALIKPSNTHSGQKRSYLIQLTLSDLLAELSDQRVLSWLKT